MSKQFYQEFKTVMEMVYVVQKAYYAYPTWTPDQIAEFEQKFATNLLKSYKSPHFCKEYAAYEQAVALKHRLKSPQTATEKRLVKILKELELINLACQPYRLEDKEYYRKQADTRLKYEKRLKANQEKNFPPIYSNPKGRK
jgi:hypothetical protein